VKASVSIVILTVPECGSDGAAAVTAPDPGPDPDPHPAVSTASATSARRVR
jgi:hypothetical protein